MSDRQQMLSELDGMDDAKAVDRRGSVLWTIAECLMRLDRFEEAAETFSLALPILWRSEVNWSYAVNATSRTTVALLRLARYEEAADLLKDLVDRVGLDWADPALPDLVPQAVGSWLFALEQLGLFDDAYEAADALIEAYDPPPPTSVVRRIVVDSALRTKGAMAFAREDCDEALPLLEEAIRRTASHQDQSAVFTWAQAMLVRGALLEKTDSPDDALATYDELLARCGESSEPFTRTVIAAARENAAQLRH